MSLRDIVAGSDMCTPSGNDGAGPSNAVGSLVNTLLGTGKTQEQLREVCSKSNMTWTAFSPCRFKSQY